MRARPGSKPELLRYLMELGLEPGARLRLEKREPFGGPLRLRLGGGTMLLGPEAAGRVYVAAVENR